MLREKVWVDRRLYIRWKPCPWGLEPGHLSGGGAGAVTWVPSPASVPGSAQDKADAVRCTWGKCAQNTRPLSL